MSFEGNFDADYKVLAMMGSSPGPDGNSQKFRTATEMQGTDRMTSKMFMFAAADGKEELAFTIEYTRKKRTSCYRYSTVSPYLIVKRLIVKRLIVKNAEWQQFTC